MMEFNQIKSKFHDNILSILENPEAILPVDVPGGIADVECASIHSLSSEDFD